MTRKNRSEDTAGVRQVVREGYGRIARNEGLGCGASGCCWSGSGDAIARSVGYDDEDLACLPDKANMGLSCGNPTALASLQPGDVVLDLGSGGGFDVFIAAGKVGRTGRVIGVDMTPDMLDRARRNQKSFTQRSGLDIVEFRLGEIENLPVADNSIDVVISNCVINLSPHKERVWREITRVLKPGGRVSVSDLALLRHLPDEIVEMAEALVGCVAGAVLMEETERMAREAGLTDIRLQSKPEKVNAMSDWEDPLYRKVMEHLPRGTRPGDYITSLDITARKPVVCGCGY